MPHEVVRDELSPPFECPEQGNRSVGPDQSDAGVDLGHGEAAAGRGDGITFSGVGLLPYAQAVHFALEAARSTALGVPGALAPPVAGPPRSVGSCLTSFSSPLWSRVAASPTGRRYRVCRSGPRRLGQMPGLCKGCPVTSIVVSSGGSGYGLLIDDQGRLRQAGFGPEIDAHMQRLPAGIPPNLYPLAYPAYDEDPTRAPSLRVTHSGGTTTTRLRVEDVRVVGPETDILLVDPDCPLAVTLCFHAEDHGVLRQWARITNRQPGAITLHEVAAASPLLAAASPHLTHFGGGDWSAEWTTTTELLTPGTKVVDSRRGSAAPSAVLSLLPPRPRWIAPKKRAAPSSPERSPGAATPASPSSGRPPPPCGSGAGTTRRRRSTCSTPKPPSSPLNRSGSGRPRVWGP